MSTRFLRPTFARGRGGLQHNAERQQITSSCSTSTGTRELTPSLSASPPEPATTCTLQARYLAPCGNVKYCPASWASRCASLARWGRTILRLLCNRSRRPAPRTFLRPSRPRPRRLDQRRRLPQGQRTRPQRPLRSALLKVRPNLVMDDKLLRSEGLLFLT